MNQEAASTIMKMIENLSDQHGDLFKLSLLIAACAVLLLVVGAVNLVYTALVGRKLEKLEKMIEVESKVRAALDKK